MQPEKSEVDPALRSTAGVSDEKNQKQQQEHGSVERVGEPIEIVIIEGHGCQHRYDAQTQPEQLPGWQAAGVLFGDVVIRAIDRRDADGNKDQR